MSSVSSAIDSVLGGGSNLSSSSESSSSSSSSLQLDSLPDDCLHSILEFFTSYELLVRFVHGAPCRRWFGLWADLAVFAIDLERDVGEAAAAAAAEREARERERERERDNKGKNKTTNYNTNALAGTGVVDKCDVVDVSHPVVSGGDSGAPLDVTRIIARKKSDYGQLLHLVSQHCRHLQVLCLDNFGSILADEVEVAPIVDPSTGEEIRPATRINFQGLLNQHATSLVAISLVASAIRTLAIGPEFVTLDTLDLSKCKSLLDPLIRPPNLTSLDLSRTLLNDFELLKILPNLPRLRILRVIGCKNLRLLDGADRDPIRLWEEQVPDLRILDLSNTGTVDASVNIIVKHCKKLEILFLNDCFALRAPQIVSNSLLTLSLRQCNRLKQSMRIWCPALRELDLSKANIKDAMINGDGSPSAPGQIHIPSIEVLMLKNLYELTRPIFTNGVEPDTHASTAVASSARPLPVQLYPNLHTLDLSMCVGLKNAALYRLLEMAPNIAFLNLQQCKEVRAAWSDDADGAQPAEERFDVIPPSLAHLSEVCLRGLEWTDENIRRLMDSPSGSSLRSLNLRHCPKVSGRFIRGSMLVEIDLRRTGLTDTALNQLLAEHACPNLKVLWIGQCEKIISVSIHHHGIEELDLSHCGNLRSAVVAASNLRRLDASMNFALTVLDVSRCARLATLNVQYSSLVQITPPDSSDPDTPQMELIQAKQANGATNDKPWTEMTPVHKPLNAYSSSLDPDEPSVVRSAARSIPSTRSPQSASRTAGVSIAAGRRPSIDGSGAASVGWSANTNFVGSSTYNVHDSAPLHSALPRQYNHTPVMVHTPPNSSSTVNLTTVVSAGARNLTPPTSPLRKPNSAPPSPAKEIQLSPAGTRGQIKQMSVNVPTVPESTNRVSGHPSVPSAPLASSSSSSSSSLPPVSSPSSSSCSPSLFPSSSSSFVPRGIRSLDILLSDERIRDLESKLQVEIDRLAAPNAGGADQPERERTAKTNIYGLKRQIAVQKAKLKKEQLQRAIQAQNEQETDENEQDILATQTQ